MLNGSKVTQDLGKDVFQIHANLFKGLEILGDTLGYLGDTLLGQNKEFTFFNSFDFVHFWPFLDVYIPKNHQTVKNRHF